VARVAYQSSLDVVDELLRVAEQRGTIHLATEVDVAPGTYLRISGRDLVNFGTCGYLALEQDERVRRGAIDAVERFGVQFSVSRSYVTSVINLELEELLRDIYNGHPTIVYSSTSLCHMSVLPRLVSAGEAIVLDQQVYFSVQTAAQLAQQRGAELMMIRHSRLDMLENKIKHLGARHKKVWYLIDGVYSMYGDVAPIKELAQLMEVYPALHLYIDDAHGMSWYGQHGAGYVFDTLGRRLSERVVLVTTLAKGFGTVGGIAVFPTEELFRKVRVVGGPLMFSHPLPPPMLGASIASARIHLSGEIFDLQTELAQRTEYCNRLLRASNLPVLSDPRTPIYFVALGEPRVGYTMVRRMLDEASTSA
jgi:7-keto-8-aminopelargonate synthetase-like enzyme